MEEGFGFQGHVRCSATVERVIDGVPTIRVADGKPVEDRLRRARAELDDILEAMGERQGLAGLDEIRWAVLETDGTITVIPRR